MSSDKKPTDIDRPYREAQRGTEEYLDLIREYLESDIGHLASQGKFDKAIQSRFAQLVASGRLDRQIIQQIPRASKRSGHRLMGWGISFALGAIIATLSFYAGFRTRGPSSGGNPTQAEAEMAAEQATMAGGQVADPGGVQEEEEPFESPGQIIALYDEKLGGESEWFAGILAELRAEASDDLEVEIGRWLAGGAFDTTRVRTGMALWVLSENGWPVHLDGVYEPDCTGTNCPNIRSAWTASLDLDTSDLVPNLPSGDAWRVPSEALAPFEKFLIAQHILQSSPNG